ncbi:MAG: TIGR03086 family metal-binding protein [Nocardioidaceae bacterium]
MSSPPARAWMPPGRGPVDGPALLERAVGYTRTALQLVATADLSVGTPCPGWDLLTLLRHMDDSLAAFTDAAEIGYVDLVPVRGDRDPRGAGSLLVDRLKVRACAALAAWAEHPGSEVSVAGRSLHSDLLAAAGSLEIAVHGWDVAQACGEDRPLPAALALDLLDVLPLLVQHTDRPRRFAEPVDVPLHARASTRLLAAVGRDA